MSSEEGKNRTGVSHRPYDEAFKRAAVAQWQNGVPASRVAEGLGHPSDPARWQVDITYVPTAEGGLYLAGVLDLGSRRMVGWAMGENLDTSLPMDALRMALRQRQPKFGFLHHSDRSCQYASEAYRERHAAWQVNPSMSCRGNCYDNVAMENFWNTLKEELVHRTCFESRAQAPSAIFDYIELFYNRERLHSALDFISPVEFEKQSSLN